MKKRFLPLVCFLGTIIFTILASIVPLNGVTQADVSNKFYTIITPAGFTFSIWLIIYLSWFVISMMIAFKDFKIDKEQKLLFSASMTLTALWLVPWHFSHVWMSLSIIFLLLFMLGFLLFDVKNNEVDKRFELTIELFIWWILVATLLNTLVFLVAIGQQGQSMLEIAIGIAFLFMGLIANLFLINKMDAYIPGLVYVWALYGIYAWQSNFYIKITALLFAIVLLLNHIYLRKKIYKKTLKQLFKN